ncbi:MAG: DUF5721 family protein [Dorea sp.]|nr:DUF5721 family protein [Dorea sp.]
MNILTLQAKTCMAHLLLKETFDNYTFVEGDITTFNKFHIDGYLHKDFFDEEPEEDYSTWKDVREFFLTIIRGKRTPLDFKFVLALPKETLVTFLKEHQLDTSYQLEEIQGLYLNLRYNGEILQCITGTSLKSFRMDKLLEREWDAFAVKIFKSVGIEVEVED